MSQGKKVNQLEKVKVIDQVEGRLLWVNFWLFDAVGGG